MRLIASPKPAARTSSCSAVKAHQVAPIAPDVASILSPTTTVLTAQNGIPWWYFFKHGGPHEGVRLKSVDPGGVIADHLPIDAHHRQHRLSRGRDRTPGRDQAHRRQSLPARRDRRLEKRARRRVVADLLRGRLQGAGRRRRPRRNLDEAAGAISPSIRSARSPTRRSTTSAASRRPARSRRR